MDSPVNDFLKLHFVVLIWGFSAILGLLISLPAVEIVFYRTLLAALVLFIVVFVKRKSFAIGLREILKILGTGFIIAAHWILFFAAARISTASVCLAGLATCSLWTSFLEPLLNGRRVKIVEVALGLTVIGGLYIIFRFEINHAAGLFMAVISAFLAAIFSVINGKLTLRHNPYIITFYEMLGACLGTILFFPVYVRYFTNDGLQLRPIAPDWFWLFILSVICTVYAFSASVELMKRISAFVVNLTVNLEPVYGIILATLIFGDREKMSSGFYLGGSVILLSVLAYPVIDKIRKS